VASERGQLREDIRPGLRVAGFEHRVAIAFIVEDERVIILRVFYGGQNWTDLI
jgi:toxin ParE1/3/4